MEIEQTQQLLQEAQKAQDKAIAESYEQLRNLLSGDAQSQWDCVCHEMHKRDSWAAANVDVLPGQKKMQAILALNLPNNVKELRHFLGMVQYYRDMWARGSEMLSPLTDLVGECGETKTTRMNKTKKKPWQWDPIHQQAFDDVKAAIAKETVLALI